VSSGELILIAAVTCFGLATARELLLTHRWEPSHFRSGLRVFHQSILLPGPVSQVPMPKSEWHLLQAARVDSRRLTDHEILFLAPYLTWPSMRGWLRYVPDAHQISARGQLNWASLGLWGCMAFLGWPFALAMLLFAAWAYGAERLRFSRILHEVAAEAGRLTTG